MLEGSLKVVQGVLTRRKYMQTINIHSQVFYGFKASGKREKCSSRLDMIF